MLVQAQIVIPDFEMPVNPQEFIDGVNNFVERYQQRFPEQQEGGSLKRRVPLAGGARVRVANGR